MYFFSSETRSCYNQKTNLSKIILSSVTFEDVIILWKIHKLVVKVWILHIDSTYFVQTFITSLYDDCTFHLFYFDFNLFSLNSNELVPLLTIVLISYF